MYVVGPQGFETRTKGIFVYQVSYDGERAGDANLLLLFSYLCVITTIAPKSGKAKLHISDMQQVA
jgi:hypothetical protein